MAVTEKDIQESKRVYKEKYGFADPDQAIYKAPKGFDPERVIEIPQAIIVKSGALKRFAAHCIPWRSVSS